jgi:hypothetical protein
MDEAREKAGNPVMTNKNEAKVWKFRQTNVSGPEFANLYTAANKKARFCGLFRFLSTFT